MFENLTPWLTKVASTRETGLIINLVEEVIQRYNTNINRGRGLSLYSLYHTISDVVEHHSANMLQTLIDDYSW